MAKKTSTARRLKKNRHGLSPDAPLLHQDHKRPVTRRDFLRQGFLTGAGITLGGSVFSLFTNPRAAQAALSSDLSTLANSLPGCSLGAIGTKVPFICFDLAGGSNIIGSNVLAGGQGGYLNDPISAAGYSKMGIPGDMVPGVVDAAASAMSGPNNDWIDTRLGLPFHSDSGFLRGILEKISLTGTAPFVNGAVIPARSDNDTGNNPHNPMYRIAATGADGDVVTLIGSRNSESGGNSMAPPDSIDPSIRPTKVDRPSDVTGMVDTGDLTAVLTETDAKAVMESIARLSDKKVANINAATVVKDLVNCGYLNAADIADRFVGVDVDPATDSNIVDPTNSGNAIFDQNEFDNEGEFRKTAAVMKMVIDGHAGAGTITMGGFDYHTGDRSTGERRDLRAGRCMGACLEYAARMRMPLMLYVFSDGSVASNGSTDGSVDGRGKGVWTGDNSSTAGAFFLVYNPTENGGQATLFSGDTLGPERHQQLGWFRADGSVETASSVAANNVNLLVDTVVLNYLALHGTDYRNVYRSLFPNNDLGTDAHMMSLTAFDPIR
ncbi:MAG TPA: general secretion pathway protein GspF [Gammaproteobacteria bacterium]|nr:general secretion pathway protein GspF [Gammaproteobacteria bacterium]